MDAEKNDLSSGVYSQHKPRQASPDQAKKSDSKLGNCRCLPVTPIGKGAARWARDTAQGRERHTTNLRLPATRENTPAYLSPYTQKPTESEHISRRG